MFQLFEAEMSKFLPSAWAAKYGINVNATTCHKLLQIIVSLKVAVLNTNISYLAIFWFICFALRKKLNFNDFSVRSGLAV